MSGRVTVAGGGLAGLSAACGLASAGADVEVLEAGHYPRHKVCGEFLCGVGPGTLRTLGIEACLDGAARLSTMAWFWNGRKILSPALPAPACGLSRRALDVRLRDRVLELGGEVREGVRSEDRDREGLLWCAGRPKRGGAWLGLKAHFTGLEPVADLEMHMGRGGYVGLSRVEGGHVNVCGLFSRAAATGSRASFPLAAACRRTGLDTLAERLEAASVVHDSIRATPGFCTGWAPPPEPGHCRARIGDAVGMIPPFSGNGMSMAIEGAAEAVGLVGQFLAGGLPWRDVCRGLHTRLRKRFGRRMLLAAAVHPFLLSSAGQVLLTGAARAKVLPIATLFLNLR